MEWIVASPQVPIRWNSLMDKMKHCSIFTRRAHRSTHINSFTNRQENAGSRLQRWEYAWAVVNPLDCRVQSFIGSTPPLIHSMFLVRGPEGVVESSRIAVYAVPCGLIWGAEVALFVGKAVMEALALSGITGWAPWGERDALFVGEADMEAFALWAVTDWAAWWEGDLENKPLNGRSGRDFFDCLPGGVSDMSRFRYYAVRRRDSLGG